MPGGSSVVGDYLRARRGAVLPEDIGLPSSANRRVAGLRRQEVAERAGISPEYYLRLEQGRDQQPSDQVVAALGRALLLDADSLDYLRRISRPMPARRRGSRPSAPPIDDVAHLLDNWTTAPAYVVDRNQDVVTANSLARALAPHAMSPGANIVRTMFLSTDRNRFRHWERAARSAVAALRYHSDPADPRVREIVEDLSESADFRRIWALHEARARSFGTVSAFVPSHGWTEFRWQSLEIPRSPGCVTTVYFGDRDSTAEAAIRSLSAATA